MCAVATLTVAGVKLIQPSGPKPAPDVPAAYDAITKMQSDVNHSVTIYLALAAAGTVVGAVTAFRSISKAVEEQRHAR